MTSWMQYRIRSRWLAGNLPLVILRLLRNAELCKWEVLDSLYRSFGLTPNDREFERTLEFLVSQGYLEAEKVNKKNRMRISTVGLKLLSEFEKEYFAIITNFDSQVE